MMAAPPVRLLAWASVTSVLRARLLHGLRRGPAYATRHECASAMPQADGAAGKGREKAAAQRAAAPNASKETLKDGVKKISKSTAKRRRTKAFPLDFGKRERQDAKAKRLKETVSKKVAGDRTGSAFALKVLEMRAGKGFKSAPPASAQGEGSDDSDLEDLIDELM
eukprot:Tamp_31010.p1 GENE.Tamp_31010~~Tamp_31010.p1  ORF type:complete len:182 (+),score=39.68 Tamp_31010:51-548(+)